MSMLSEQVNKIRKVAKCVYLATDKEVADDIASTLNQSADTIEALSAKLQAENMERLNRYYNCGWILRDDRLPVTAEYMELEPTPYMKRLEIAYMADTVEYILGFYDGSKWMDKHHNIIKNVIAWKPFVKLPEPYRP